MYFLVLKNNSKKFQNSIEKQSSHFINQKIEIETPKRESLLLSPSALIQIGASPDSKRYDSIRKIDFEGEERKIHASVRKLDFLK